MADKKLSDVLEDPVNPELAEEISIENPDAFQQSIQKVKSDGRVTEDEFFALQAAQNAAELQLKRSDLTPKERKEFLEIARMDLPEKGEVRQATKQKKEFGVKIPDNLMPEVPSLDSLTGEGRKKGKLESKGEGILDDFMPDMEPGDML